jgi:hypothetical protein
MSFSKKIITVVFRLVFPKSGYPQMCLNRQDGSFFPDLPGLPNLIILKLETHVTHLSFLRKQESVKKHGFPLSRE